MKSSIWFKIVILVFIILVLTMIANRNSPDVEGFTQKRKFVSLDNDNLYDFYCSVYDQLLFDPQKNSFEVTELDKVADIDKKSNILDVGCGLGHHVEYYREKGVNVGIR